MDLVSHGRGAAKGLAVGVPFLLLGVAGQDGFFPAEAVGAFLGGTAGVLGAGIGALTGDHRHYWPEPDSLAAWRHRTTHGSDSLLP